MNQIEQFQHSIMMYHLHHQRRNGNRYNIKDEKLMILHVEIIRRMKLGTLKSY